MAEIPIKIHILDREYTIKAEQRDAEVVKRAALQLNETLQHFKQQFRISDKQDLLSMVAFDIVFQQLLTSEEVADYQKKITNIDQMVERAIGMLDNSKSALV